MSPEFRTTDVDLAALLTVRGFPVDRVEAPQSPPWLAEFVFPRTYASEGVVERWLDQEAPCEVDARAFARARVRLYRRARDVLDETRPGYRERGRMR